MRATAVQTANVRALSAPIAVRMQMRWRYRGLPLYYLKRQEATPSLALGWVAPVCPVGLLSFTFPGHAATCCSTPRIARLATNGDPLGRFALL